MIKWNELPIEIQNRMLDCQEEQENKRDESVFEKDIYAGYSSGGFNWDETKEGFDFWDIIISHSNTDHFYTLYPKQKHISSYDELIVGQYYWVKLCEKWFPAPYKFNNHFIIDGLAIPKEHINLENIEPLKHE